MHHPTDRIAHTTTFVTPVVEHWLERDFRSASILKDTTIQMLICKLGYSDFVSVVKQKIN